MGQPAARIGDTHLCPVHGGGPILTGCASVLIGGAPAARVSDKALCPKSPPDSVAKGEDTVLIGGLPAARLGDKCAHRGMIVAGCPTVLIGKDQGQCLQSAAASGAVFVPGWD